MKLGMLFIACNRVCAQECMMLEPKRAGIDMVYSAHVEGHGDRGVNDGEKTHTHTHTQIVGETVQKREREGEHTRR